MTAEELATVRTWVVTKPTGRFLVVIVIVLVIIIVVVLVIIIVVVIIVLVVGGATGRAVYWSGSRLNGRNGWHLRGTGRW
jgi:5-bromo-4-chloroindolyl phosphate hydrolysis protein